MKVTTITSFKVKMRIEVLKSYRKLYRTCQTVFQGDYTTLIAARKKLKEEFLKNSKVSDEAVVKELVEEAQEAEQFLRERVVQAFQTGDNTFRLHITKETVLEDNAKPLKSKPDNN